MVFERLQRKTLEVALYAFLIVELLKLLMNHVRLLLQ